MFLMYVEEKDTLTVINLHRIRTVKFWKKTGLMMVSYDDGHETLIDKPALARQIIERLCNLSSCQVHEEEQG